MTATPFVRRKIQIDTVAGLIEVDAECLRYVAVHEPYSALHRRGLGYVISEIKTGKRLFPENIKPKLAAKRLAKDIDRLPEWFGLKFDDDGKLIHDETSGTLGEMLQTYYEMMETEAEING